MVEISEGARVEKRGGKWRLIDTKSGRIKTDKWGQTMDNGGFASEAEAKKRMAAINAYKWRGKGESVTLPPGWH